MSQEIDQDRRRFLGAAAMALAGARLAAAVPPTIETHVHLFDPARVPYAADAPYKPAAYTLEDHLKLVEAVGLAHSVIVHPEPYQDDHRYLEYCLAHEPRPGYFKATCLFDPLREDTPARLRALAAHDTGSLAINILVGFGVIAVSAGAVALVPTPMTALLLGFVVFAIGLTFTLQRNEQWGLFAQICLAIGALMFSGGVLAIGRGALSAMLIVTAALAGASIVDGPTTADAYLLHVAPQQRHRALAKLQSDDNVQMAQPIDGATS